jgi:hypothetical protein
VNVGTTPGSRRDQGVEVFSCEAVVPHRGDGPLHAGLVLGTSHPGGVHLEAASLGILAEGGNNERRERVR